MKNAAKAFEQVRRATGVVRPQGTRLVRQLKGLKVHLEKNPNCLMTRQRIETLKSMGVK